MFKKLTTVVFVLLAIFGSSFALAASPFDRSDRICRANKNLGCAMAVSGERTTISDVVNKWHSSLDRLSELNDWKKGEVTMNSVIPFNKKFAVIGELPSWAMEAIYNNKNLRK